MGRYGNAPETLTDTELAHRYGRAAEANNEEEAIIALNYICIRLDLPLDWTEQGLNDQANAAIDAFLKANGVAVRPY